MIAFLSLLLVFKLPSILRVSPPHVHNVVVLLRLGTIQFVLLVDIVELSEDFVLVRLDLILQLLGQKLVLGQCCTQQTCCL